jgi:hypothetical protein
MSAQINYGKINYKEQLEMLLDDAVLSPGYYTFEQAREIVKLAKVLGYKLGYENGLKMAKLIKEKK